MTDRDRSMGPRVLGQVLLDHAPQLPSCQPGRAPVVRARHPRAEPPPDRAAPASATRSAGEPGDVPSTAASATGPRRVPRWRVCRLRLDGASSTVSVSARCGACPQAWEVVSVAERAAFARRPLRRPRPDVAPPRSWCRSWCPGCGRPAPRSAGCCARCDVAVPSLAQVASSLDTVDRPTSAVAASSAAVLPGRVSNTAHTCSGTEPASRSPATSPPSAPWRPQRPPQGSPSPRRVACRRPYSAAAVDMPTRSRWCAEAVRPRWPAPGAATVAGGLAGPSVAGFVFSAGTVVVPMGPGKRSCRLWSCRRSRT